MIWLAMGIFLVGLIAALLGLIAVIKGSLWQLSSRAQGGATILVGLVLLVASMEMGSGSETGDGSGTSARDPIPFRQEGELPTGDWKVRIIGAFPDSNAFVQRENGRRPKPGNQFYMVRAEITYTGNDSGVADLVSLDAVGDSEGRYTTPYTTLKNGCGDISFDDFGGGEIHQGEKAQGNVCWEVPRSDVPALLAFAHGFLDGEGSSGLFFSLKK